MLLLPLLPLWWLAVLTPCCAVWHHVSCCWWACVKTRASVLWPFFPVSWRGQGQQLTSTGAARACCVRGRGVSSARPCVCVCVCVRVHVCVCAEGERVHRLARAVAARQGSCTFLLALQAHAFLA
jgi:hypothetical protein